MKGSQLWFGVFAAFILIGRYHFKQEIMSVLALVMLAESANHCRVFDCIKACGFVVRVCQNFQMTDNSQEAPHRIWVVRNGPGDDSTVAHYEARQGMHMLHRLVTYHDFSKSE